MTTKMMIMMMMITGRGLREEQERAAAEEENSLADVNECWLLNFIARKLKLAERGGREKCKKSAQLRRGPPSKKGDRIYSGRCANLSLN